MGFLANRGIFSYYWHRFFLIQVVIIMAAVSYTHLTLPTSDLV